MLAALAALVSGAAGGHVASTTYPVTITTASGKVTIAKKPRRIVSLSPTATESLFAIGAGPQVVAVDDQSDYPKSAPRTALSGFTPNVEAIAAYRP
ncbi:MAG: ABC transporter substrate-binding protein, partial [Gaiellaceae bacterium]